MSIINIRTGGLAIYGGLIGAVIGAVIFTRVRKINFFLSPIWLPHILLWPGYRTLGQFRESGGIWNEYLPALGMHSKAVQDYLTWLGDSSVDPLMPVHPTFLYESIWNFAVFSFLIWHRKRYKVPGELFFFILHYMALEELGLKG